MSEMRYDDEEFGFPGDYITEVISLTVSESKRLIARAVAADPRVQQAMEDGMVAVCKGTTNAYIVEELLGQRIAKGKYVLGRTVPVNCPKAQEIFNGQMLEYIFRNGQPVEGLTLEQAMQEMKAGDVVIKGANALDYSNNLAGVLIGHPEGGTLGTILGSVFGKGLHLLIPVGLEKQVGTPLARVAEVATPAECAEAKGPRLWVLQGHIYTEIEALQGLAGVETIQIGAGGVCGAEGAVWLLMSGYDDDIIAAREIISQVKGEPGFGED